MKGNLFWFLEDQTHISTCWHAKMSLTLNESVENILHSNLHTTITSRLSTHTFKCEIFLTKIKVQILLFEHVMQIHLSTMHEI